MTPVEKVLAICKEKGIRISKLERDLGYANGYVKGLKGGQFPIGRAIQISRYLNVPMSKIEPECNEELQLVDMSITENELVNRFRTLNDTGKEKLLDYLSDLLDNPKYTGKKSLISDIG